MAKFLNSEQINFVKEHITDDTVNLALIKNKLNVEDVESVINDISCRQKLIKKFPEWATNFDLTMPFGINIEQSSSRETARFKASIFNYSNSLDLTSGFGIDTYFLALKSENHIAVEKNFSLCRVLVNNLKNLHINNTIVLSNTAEEFLERNTIKYDLVYLDPSRRINQKRKIFDYEDYEPNLNIIFSKIRLITRYLLVKLSPMLDISFVKNKFPDCSDIYILSIDGEVKELLLAFDFLKHSISTQIHAVELGDNKFQHFFDDDEELDINFGMPEQYIYDIHPAIKKTGYSEHYADSLGLAKISFASNIYTSNEFVGNFCGKVYRLISVVKPDSKEIQKVLPEMKAIVVKNGFNLSVDAIRKKYKILEGDEKVIFAVKLLSGKSSFLITEKINNYPNIIS